MDERTYWLLRKLKECGRKTRYLNEAAAKRNCPGSRVVYPCTFCGFYHTGHLKRKTSISGSPG
jgi:hypothetical protein